MSSAANSCHPSATSAAGISMAIGLQDAHLTGAHLRLPGLGDDGPTIEIFSYDACLSRTRHTGGPCRLGPHRLPGPRRTCGGRRGSAAGGGRVGDIITTRTADGRRVTWGLHDRPRRQHRGAPGQSPPNPKGLMGTPAGASVSRRTSNGWPRSARPSARRGTLQRPCGSHSRPGPGRRRGRDQRHPLRLSWRSARFDVTAEPVGDDIVITLEDEAPVFDPTAVLPPDLAVPPHRRTPGGMGIHRCRATDLLEHRPRPGVATYRP